jgi:hypothetical protein
MAKYSDENGRQCSKCDTYKPWAEFNKYKGGVNGRRPVCRECSKAYDKNYERGKDMSSRSSFRWRDRHPEQYREGIRKSQQRRAEEYKYLKVRVKELEQQLADLQNPTD